MAAVLLLIGGNAFAESVQSRLLEKTGIDALAELSRELGGIDVERAVARLMTGELRLEAGTVRRWLERFGASLREELTGVLTALAAPVLASLALRALLGRRADGGAVALLGRVGCAALLMERCVAAQRVAEAALSALTQLVGAASPVLIAALTLTGSAQKAAILTPSTALCAGLIERLLREIALSMCGVAAAIAAAANLSDRFQLNRLFELLCRGLTWGVGLLMAGFVGFMAVEGLLASSQDALSARAVRRAIQAALPVIGGEVSDSAGALLGSALAMRNAVGVAGMLAMLGVSLAPIARLAVSTYALKLASAILEPVADAGVTRIVGHFGDVSRLLLAICAGGTLLAVLLLGACLALAA